VGGLHSRNKVMSLGARISGASRLNCSVLIISLLSLSACNSSVVHSERGSNSPRFSVHVIDGRSGHGIVIKREDREIIIDGGDDAALAEYVARKNLITDPIELVVVTDASAGSWQGIRYLLSTRAGPRLRVSEVWEPGYTSGEPSRGYQQFIDSITGRPDISLRRPLERARLGLGRPHGRAVT
jgi:hypothetical protein